MCAGALVNSRVDRLVFGAKDQKAGAIVSLMQICTDERLNHRLIVEQGVLEGESAGLLKVFFQELRGKIG
jgi:tRNA(adenine34) deaminase